VNIPACEREHEIVELIQSGQWPPVDGELRAHADGCPLCAELSDIAARLHDDRADAFRDARVPTSGQVWWRATVRTRAEAMAKAARPITLLQGVAAACAAGICAAVITLAWPSLHPLLVSLASPESGASPTATSALLATLSREAQRVAAIVSAGVLQQAVLSLVAVFGAAAILVPFALYFVLSDD
jgi:hypothetical protein